jgi:hypothetical protein
VFEKLQRLKNDNCSHPKQGALHKLLQQEQARTKDNRFRALVYTKHTTVAKDIAELLITFKASEFGVFELVEYDDGVKQRCIQTNAIVPFSSSFECTDQSSVLVTTYDIAQPIDYSVFDCVIHYEGEAKPDLELMVSGQPTKANNKKFICQKQLRSFTLLSKYEQEPDYDMYCDKWVSSVRKSCFSEKDLKTGVAIDHINYNIIKKVAKEKTLYSKN